MCDVVWPQRRNASDVASSAMAYLLPPAARLPYVVILIIANVCVNTVDHGILAPMAYHQWRDNDGNPNLSS